MAIEWLMEWPQQVYLRDEVRATFDRRGAGPKDWVSTLHGQEWEFGDGVSVVTYAEVRKDREVVYPHHWDYAETTAYRCPQQLTAMPHSGASAWQRLADWVAWRLRGKTPA